MKKDWTHIWKLFFVMEAALLGFLGLFYVSCGRQLYARSSNGTVEAFPSTNDTGELVRGSSVEQIYTSQMDVIQKIGILVSNYGRDSGEELLIRCEDLTDQKVIAEAAFPTRDLGIQTYVYLDAAGGHAEASGNEKTGRENPDGYAIGRGHRVKITVSCNGEAGAVPTVLYHAGEILDNRRVAQDAGFFVNGEAVDGTMCFTVQGYDLVWSGPNYWKLVLSAAVFAALIFWTAALRYVKGRREYLFSTMAAMRKYQFLIEQLVSRDFKVRYKRSVLGVFWSFLNPLLMMAVQYIVFSQLFKSDIDNYPVYLLSGLVVFNFFTEGANQALTSISGNAALISKVYMPKYVYPVTRVLSSGINLLMSLIPLMIAAAVTRERFTLAYLMLPYILLCLVGFTIGFGMGLGALIVFFRDIQFLWGILSMLWMYLTPLFYPLSIIPAGARHLFGYNPMYYFVDAVRTIVMHGITPQPAVFFRCTAVTVCVLALGGIVFRKTQDRFIFYL